MYQRQADKLRVNWTEGTFIAKRTQNGGKVELYNRYVDFVLKCLLMCTYHVREQNCEAIILEACLQNKE